MYKIYYLSSSNDSTIKYIGLTKNSLKNRLNGHLYSKENNKKSAWIKSIINNNSKVLINLIEDNIETIEKAYEREIYYINFYKNLGLDLKNQTEGGLINHKKYIKLAISSRKKKINMYNIYGELLNKFDSVTLAAKYLNTPVSNISRSLKGFTVVKNKFIFKYENENFSPIYNRKIPISVLDIKSEIIYKFNTIKEACKQLHVSEITVRNCLNNIATHKKFIFNKL